MASPWFTPPTHDPDTPHPMRVNPQAGEGCALVDVNAPGGYRPVDTRDGETGPDCE